MTIDLTAGKPSRVLLRFSLPMVFSVLLQQLVQKKATDPAMALPKIYISCGDRDSLLRASRLYKEKFETAGFPITYEETAGGHEWNFWDSQILKVLNWLEL